VADEGLLFELAGPASRVSYVQLAVYRAFYQAGCVYPGHIVLHVVFTWSCCIACHTYSWQCTGPSIKQGACQLGHVVLRVIRTAGILQGLLSGRLSCSRRMVSCVWRVRCQSVRTG
jgi:hypothetical protein